MVFDHDFLNFSINPNLGIYDGIVSNLVCQFQNWCLWFIIIGNGTCCANRSVDLILSPM